MSASVRDVAKRAGVAVGTVSNVLNRPEKVSEHILHRVLAAIDELDFVRNDAARQLRSGRSASIGLVLIDVQNPFFTDVARGAERRAADERLSVTLGNSDSDPGRQAAYLDLYEQQRVQGILITPHGEVHERLVQLKRRGTPVVLIGRGVVDPTFSMISDDDLAGGRLAAEHLIEQGRTRIAFVGTHEELGHIADRLEGARRTIAEHPGVILDVIQVASLDVDNGKDAGARIVARPRSERPDAVFAANDLIAIGLLQSLTTGGVDVPGDIAVIGYDDIAFARAASVPLSSIRQPSALIGQTAVEILLWEAANPEAAPQQIVFKPELVVRESTGNP